MGDVEGVSMGDVEGNETEGSGGWKPRGDDLAANAHLHHSAAEEEALRHPDWLPARVPEVAGALVVFLLVIGVAVGVVLRYAGQGVLGLIELASLSMLILVVLGAVGLSYRDEHVRLELIDMVLGDKGVRRLEPFVDVFQLVVTAVVTYALWEVFRSDLLTGTTLSGELGIARKWVSGTAVICFLLVGVVLVRKLLVDVRALRKDRVRA